MAFKPSYNIMDRDTHNALVNAFNTGGIGYTDDDGTVHKISEDYVGGGGSASYDFIVRVNLNEDNFVSAETIYMADADYLKNKIDNNLPITGQAYKIDAISPTFTANSVAIVTGLKEIDGDNIYYDINVCMLTDYNAYFNISYSLNTNEWYSN